MTLVIDNPAKTELPTRSKRVAMWRGFTGRCPACGKGHLFRAFLKVAGCCVSCGEELHHHRADDAPPYFTIFIIGHIVVPLVIVVEKLYHPALLVHFVLWLTVTVALAILLMPRVKGAIVGLQWALRMHGFGGAGESDSQ